MGLRSCLLLIWKIYPSSSGFSGLNCCGIPENGNVMMDEILALEYREGNKYIQYVKTKGWTNVADSP